MKKSKVLTGIFGCIVLWFVGAYRLATESLSIYPLILSVLFVLGSPVAVVVMIIKLKNAQLNGNLH
ncbi:hypothetical protein LD39_03750 [Halobacillus sp. BBL2006]|nr:hypothetical protein LD39_03750 [Halobacillus sp. BBL2006]